MIITANIPLLLCKFTTDESLGQLNTDAKPEKTGRTYASERGELQTEIELSAACLSIIK